MFDFTVMVRTTTNTPTQKVKTDLVSKLLDTLKEEHDPITSCFQDKLDQMAEWFHPSKGKIKNITQHWDENIAPASGLNLILSTRALTMQDVFLINKFLKKGSHHG